MTHRSEGLLVPPGRPAELAAALLELASDERLRDALGRAAGARADQFDAAAAVAQVEALYERVVRR
jgi:glycosyltransferase involved in cell wall biosynthesis